MHVSVVRADGSVPVGSGLADEEKIVLEDAKRFIFISLHRGIKYSFQRKVTSEGSVLTSRNPLTKTKQKNINSAIVKFFCSKV